jgi:hypothetical protein
LRRKTFSAEIFNFRFQFFGFVRAFRIIKCDIRASFAEFERDCLADSGRRNV